MSQRTRDIDPIKSATSAGLRHVCDDRPGIRRVNGRFGFSYVRPDGRRIRNARELRRIAALAVPPAWTDVWICVDPRGHIQATGRDARGRKQYRYHPEWRAFRDETKFHRMQAFASVLPRLRARIEADLSRKGLPRDKVLAAVVRLLETSLIRVGNDEYARQNQSFGLTTMRDRHVKVRGGRVRFEFRGKSGIRHTVDVTDRRLARIVRQCRDLPGQELFQYTDGDGRLQDVTSADVNAYVCEATGAAFTAKDFRTWAGTVLAATALSEIHTKVPKRTKRNVLRAVEAVAGVLGNTRTVCLKSYVHPVVVTSYLDGWSLPRRRPVSLSGRSPGLRAEEKAVLALLRKKPAAVARLARAAA
jgi:DNA topoisomerase-1